MMEGKARWSWMLLLIAILLLEGWSSPSTTITIDACLEHERIALLHLKPFFNHKYLETWVDQKGNSNSSFHSNCCEWKRVECNSTTKQVISLDLSYTRIERDPIYLNAFLFLPFQELKSLDLSGNEIAGFVENEGFTWSSRLETLNLGGNSFSNSILAHVNGLSSLKSLSLYNNELQGIIHIHELNNLTKLKHLDLSGNRIESLLLTRNEETKLTNLKELDLSYNLLRNDTIAFLFWLSNLKSLDMMSNQLEGSIDIKGLNNLMNLRDLDLSENNIESFQSWGGSRRQLRMNHLERLYLGDNLFNNSVFASLSQLSNLKYLDISSNELEGSIDVKKDLSGFSNLEELDMSSNSELNEFVANKENTSLTKLKVVTLKEVFTNGSFTEVVELVKAFSSVKTFFLQRNYFYRTTAIQDRGNAFNNNVEEIILDDSYISTDFLQSFGVFTNLKALHLSRCSLKGTLPNQGWCELRNLEKMYMDGNALQGMLPTCFGNLTSLRLLDISENQFTGSLTPLANLSSLIYLSLSYNKLQVPMSFLPLTNLTHLKVLLIDENKLVMEPPHVDFDAVLPKFQLNFLSLSNCTTHQQQPLQFLYHQHDLRVVDLSYNNFNGSAHNSLLANNPKLEQLWLMGNSFTGPLLLPSLPNPNLYIFDMSHNKVQGQIPTNVCSTFPYLDTLVLCENEFKGNIPSCLGGMGALRMLDLSNNQLFGGIPEELSITGSLVLLKLSNNNLSGKIVPEIFTSNSYSRYVYLDGNNFVGEILDIDFSTFYLSLSAMDLNNNNLSGKLPRWIWNLSFLEVLALSNNSFEGSIPVELCNLDRLRILDFSHNNFSGSIPSCFNSKSIQHVHLGGNRLSGPLTEALPNSSSVLTLDLGGNNFIGSIPEWIDKLSYLTVLILKDNHLDGGIPIQLCKMDLLSILDLSKNMFSGPIPYCLGELTLAPLVDKSRTRFFGYSRNIYGDYLSSLLNGVEGILPKKHYSGLLMEESVEFATKRGSYVYKGNILCYMSGIDLSCNKLTGHIPYELGNLSGIYALNLSHNNLTGVIPSTFSRLKQIESLDLSYNDLSGKIPAQLVELNSLEVFSLAHNNLSGNTPERKAQFGTFDESSYEGNPLLCGPPLHNNCSHTDLQPTISPTSDADEDDCLLDTYVFCVTFLACYVVVLLVIFVVLYINPFWRRRWFFFIEDFIDTCRYSAVGNFLVLRIFRINAWKW